MIYRLSLVVHLPLWLRKVCDTGPWAKYASVLAIFFQASLVFAGKDSNLTHRCSIRVGSVLAEKY